MITYLMESNDEPPPIHQEGFVRRSTVRRLLAWVSSSLSSGSGEVDTIRYFPRNRFCIKQDTKQVLLETNE